MPIAPQFWLPEMPALLRSVLGAINPTFSAIVTNFSRWHWKCLPQGWIWRVSFAYALRCVFVQMYCFCAKSTTKWELRTSKQNELVQRKPNTSSISIHHRNRIIDMSRDSLSNFDWIQAPTQNLVLNKGQSILFQWHGRLHRHINCTYLSYCESARKSHLDLDV